MSNPTKPLLIEAPQRRIATTTQLEFASWSWKRLAAYFSMLQITAYFTFPALPRGIFFPVGFLVVGGYLFVYGIIKKETIEKAKRNAFVSTSEKNKIRKLIPRSKTEQAEQKFLSFQNELKVLGLSGKPTWQEIRSRYRKLAKKYHPDSSHHNGSRNAFEKIKSNYDVLNQNRSYFL